MTVLPGSLDYLYYNGILNHIPYEAYETANAGYNQINAENYLNSASQGNLYNTYTASDVFVNRNNTDYKQGENYSFSKSAFGYKDGIGKDSDFEINAIGQEGKTFRETLLESAKSTASGFSNMPTYIKGLIAGGIMTGTLYCLLKGKKPSLQTENTSFLAKLNPLKLFKK